MKNLKVESLSNNIPLFMLKSKKAPVVTLQVWVKTGSAHEFKTEAGLSHFIEHLVFKGTHSFGNGEIAQLIESVGGELNAYTSFDQTVFYVTVPYKSLHVAAHVLFEMVNSPCFHLEEVNNEREVVIEEIKMGMDQPSKVASKMLFSQMYAGHPYALPVIGTEENIRRVGLDEIKNYFNERYVGKNIALICVGDFKDDAKELLEKFFSKLDYEGLLAKDRRLTSRMLEKKNTIKFVKSEFEKDYFYLSWPVEGFLDDVVNKYELLALILGQGESSYLYKELKLKKGLCRNIGAFYFGDPKEGVFVISGVAMPKERAQLFKNLPIVINKFLNQKDISFDLEKARNIFESEASYAEESISFLCRNIGDDWLYYDDPFVTEKRREKTLKLTEKDLIKAVEKIFSKDVYLSVLSKNAPSGEDTDEMMTALKELKDVETKFQESIGHKKTNTFLAAKELEQKNYSWKTSKGSDVSFVSQSLGSVVSFKVAFEGGELLSSNKTQGLVALFGSVWAREFQGVLEQEFIEEIDFYCSDFSTFFGKHSVGLGLFTQDKYFEKLSEFFVKAIKQPVFSNIIVHREKESLLQNLKTRLDRPSAMAFNEFSKLLFKGSIYARDSVGVEEHIKNLTEKDLKIFFEKLKTKKRVYSIVGSLTKKQVEKVVESIENHLPEVKESFFHEKVIFPWGKVCKSEIESEKKQSHIIMGYPGVRYVDERKIHLALLTSLLGGQGGRLFIQLRDKASLAYSVAPLEYSGAFGGYFGGYIACDPLKKEVAIKMMREEFEKLSKETVSKEELMWMKNQVLGNFLISSQKNSFICDTMLFDSFYGLNAFTYQKLEEVLEKITSDELRVTASEILKGPEYLVSVG